MKTVTLAMAIMSLVAVAQSLDNLPSCATSCFDKSPSNIVISGCGKHNKNCICGDYNIGNVLCCVSNACSGTELQNATDAANDICFKAGTTPPVQLVCDNPSSPIRTVTDASSSADSSSSPSSSSSSEASGTAAGATSQETTTGDSGAYGVTGNVVGAALALLFTL